MALRKARRPVTDLDLHWTVGPMAVESYAICANREPGRPIFRLGLSGLDLDSGIHARAMWSLLSRSNLLLSVICVICDMCWLCGMHAELR